MGKKYTVTDIKYDTDGIKVKLPKSMEIIVPETITSSDDVLEYISDEISNRTGYCHYGFSTNPKID